MSSYQYSLNTASALKFFYKVRGNKIVMNCWSPGLEFTPDCLVFKDNSISIKGFMGNSNEPLTYPVLNGFDEDEYGFKWEILQSAVTVDNKCKCPIFDLMNVGCKCGGE